MNPQEYNTKTTPKDFFLHLGAMVTLYATVGALINLSFSIIDYYFPDALAGYFYTNSVAWPISMLVVLVPILYTLEWLINRDISHTPEKASILIRKWRLYLTLFLVVVLLGGDLIMLINTYLSGEITSRFVYKVVLILFVAGSVGKYYFFSIYSSYRWSKFIRRANAWFGVALVIVAIILGFVAVGSPSKQRALRFDNQRVNDLQNIQWQIVNYWQQKGKLPSTLSEMQDSISGNRLPLDPENKTEYVYSTKSDLKFELCATFAYPTEDLKNRGRTGVNYGYNTMSIYPSPDYSTDMWDHKAGLNCFERKIDQDRYPKLIR